jgi:hypothetical protein
LLISSWILIGIDFEVVGFQFEHKLAAGAAAEELFDVKVHLTTEQFNDMAGPLFAQRLLAAFSADIPQINQQPHQPTSNSGHVSRIDEVILRRVQPSMLPSESGGSGSLRGRWVGFHRDERARTMQVFLNDESEYVGGHLVYLLPTSGAHSRLVDIDSGISGDSHGESEDDETAAAGGLLCRVGRPLGGAVLHDSSVMHGVTRCSDGVRYSLFLLQH